MIWDVDNLKRGGMPIEDVERRIYDQYSHKRPARKEAVEGMRIAFNMFRNVEWPGYISFMTLHLRSASPAMKDGFRMAAEYIGFEKVLKEYERKRHKV